MRRILLLGMAVLLSMAVLPSYGQIDNGEELTIWEWDFANGQGDFTTWFGWDEMGHWGEEPPTVQPWQYDAENGWMVATYPGNKYIEWHLYTPFIDLTDKNYYDVKLRFEYSLQTNNVTPLDEGYSTGINISAKNANTPFLYNAAIPDMTYRPDAVVFHNAEIPIEQFRGYSIKVSFHQYQNNTEGCWYIKKVKVIGKHRFGGAMATNVSTIAEMKTLPENTFVALKNDNGISLLSSVGSQLFARDETGAMMISDGNTGNNNVIIKDVLYGIYTREHGVTEIKNVQYYGNYDWDFDYSLMNPVAITEAEYQDHECDYVVIYPQNDVHVSSSIEPLTNDAIWYTPHNATTVITGYVFPTEERGMRFVANPFSFCMTLTEDGDNIITEQDSQVGIYCRMNRQLVRNKWQTFIFPITSDYFRTAYFDAAEFVSSENGVLQFQTATTLVSGKPYLVKPKSNFTTFSGFITVNNSSPVVEYGGDYNFVGTYNPIQPADGTYYLSEGNTIKPLASGGTIKGFRAYFEPATPNAAHARAISIDGMTTAIEDIVGGEELLGLPQKIYTIGGQYVGDDLDALPKGVYLVNGKKIIK